MIKQDDSSEQTHKEVSKSNLPTPIGITTSFFSCIFLIAIAGIFRITRPLIKEVIIEDINLGFWITIWVVLIIARHQLRVLFIDSSEAAGLKPYWQKLAILLLIPLSVLGGLTWIIFGIHELLGSILMLFYSLGFTLFSLFVIQGLDKKSPQFISLFVDIGLTAFWIYHILYFSQKETGNQNGVMSLVVVVCFFILVEFTKVHRTPFLERFIMCSEYLTGEKKRS